MHRTSEKFDYVQVRHEEMAAFMASAHAKFTGELGVCMATSGPGAIHLLNGLYDARLDHQPVLAIVGQRPGPPGRRLPAGGRSRSAVQGRGRCLRPAGENPAQIRHLVDRAIRIALCDRRVTCIILPKDVQEMEYKEPPHALHGAIHTGIGAPTPQPTPAETELHRAAEALNAGKKIAMLVGAGTLHCTDEVIEVAEKLGAGVAKALLGKAAVPDDLPFVTGSIGFLGTKPSWDMMQVATHCSWSARAFPYSEFLPKEGAARGVQIDIEATMLSVRYPMEVCLLGDTEQTLRALLPMLEHKQDRSWRKKIEKDVVEWWDVLKSRAMTRPTRSIRSASSMSCRPDCPSVHPDQLIPAPAPTGMRAISRCGAA